MCKANKEDWGGYLVSSDDEIGIILDVGDRFSKVLLKDVPYVKLGDFVKVDIYCVENIWIICRVVNIKENFLIVDNKGILEFHEGGLNFWENVKGSRERTKLCKGYTCRNLSQSEFEFLDR